MEKEKIKFELLNEWAGITEDDLNKEFNREDIDNLLQN